jgi:hypothetical protein
MRYDIEHNYEWLATIDVRDEKLALEMCAEVNAFFSGSEERLKRASGNVIRAALYLYAPQLLNLCSYGEDIVSGMIGREEGFYPLDGSRGLYLRDLNSAFKGLDTFTVDKRK